MRMSTARCPSRAAVACAPSLDSHALASLAACYGCVRACAMPRCKTALPAALPIQMREHYNFERPNQALSCGNRPPRVAFPALPARPSVPLLVDPDAWLETIDGRGYVRRVQENGCVVVGDAVYYVGRDRGGQEVALVLQL